MDGTEFSRRYDDAHATLMDLGSTVHRILDELLAQESFPILSITHRVKQRSSALRKLNGRTTGGTFEEMTDLLGIRIITYMRDGVDEVAKVIERELAIDDEHSIDKRAVLDPDRFGYLSLHYIASLDEARCKITEYQRFSGWRFEIQIRSILQHAWAEIEHDLGYKSESAVPREERRSFSRLAGLLELADEEFISIRERLGQHQAATESDIATGRTDIEIDQDSLFALISSDEPVISRVDRHIAETASNGEGVLNAPSRDYAGFRVSELRELKTIEGILRSLQENEAEVTAFAQHWIKDEFPAANDMPLADEDLMEEGQDTNATVHIAFRRTPAEDLDHDWPAGVSLFYLHLYINARRILASYDSNGGWAEDVAKVDRAIASCLGAVRGQQIGLT